VNVSGGFYTVIAFQGNNKRAGFMHFGQNSNFSCQFRASAPGLRLACQSGLLAALLYSGVVHADGVPDNAEGMQAGIIKIIRGAVQVQRGNGVTPLKVGDRVYAGDRVVTAVDAAAGITLRDDTLMSLGPQSSVVLEQYNFDAAAGSGNVAVRMLKGTMRYVTGLIGKHAPERQQVTTPTATIGIRGTDFIVDVLASE
jgi:hypothetical protein